MTTSASTKTKTEIKAQQQEVLKRLVDRSHLPCCLDTLLSAREVALGLNVAISTFYQMRAVEEFPPPDVHLRSSPRWTVGTFNRWVAKQQATSKEC